MFILEVFAYGFAIFFVVELISVIVNHSRNDNNISNKNQYIRNFKNNILTPALDDLDRDIEAYGKTNKYSSRNVRNFIMRYRGFAVDYCFSKELYNLRMKNLKKIPKIDKNLSMIIFMMENIIRAFNEVIPYQIKTQEDKDFRELGALFGLAMIDTLDYTLANNNITSLDIDHNNLIRATKNKFEEIKEDIEDDEDEIDTENNLDTLDEVCDYLDEEYGEAFYNAFHNQNNESNKILNKTNEEYKKDIINLINKKMELKMEFQSKLSKVFNGVNFNDEYQKLTKDYDRKSDILDNETGLVLNSYLKENMRFESLEAFRLSLIESINYLIENTFMLFVNELLENDEYKEQIDSNRLKSIEGFKIVLVNILNSLDNIDINDYILIETFNTINKDSISLIGIFIHYFFYNEHYYGYLKNISSSEAMNDAIIRQIVSDLMNLYYFFRNAEISSNLRYEDESKFMSKIKEEENKILLLFQEITKKHPGRKTAEKIFKS